MGKLISKIILILLLSVITINVSAQDTLYLEQLTNGLASPVFVVSPPGDSRLFIVEQPGRIRIFDDTLYTVPFLDIQPQVRYGGEQGLLGLAFHPNYASNGQFFVNYTTLDDTDLYTHISRFTVSAGNPNIANAAVEDTLLRQFQPFGNHNGGMLAFGPDGYLYIGFGDGGSSGDPLNSGQTANTLLGKMLRIDVNSGSPYAIPPSNPYVGKPDTLDEIWAFGLRNPWRYSFDRSTGDLYIADVGQNLIEEIDFQPAASIGGENYGWRLKEAINCYNPTSNCENGVTLVDPISHYFRGGIPFRCSITGGYIYRGSCLPQYNGHYFYADYCSSQIWSIKYDGNSVIDSTEYILSLPVSSISSFGEDASGELYVVSLDGAIYRIVPEGGSTQCNTGDCCQGIRGNIDNDASDFIDISDLVYFVAYAFGNPAGPAPFCYEEADVNSDVVLDISDIVYLVSYMFGAPAGPAPLVC